MKRINPKRIIIGTLVGGGLFFVSVFGLWNWLINPDFPYLWTSDEIRCTQETSKQSFANHEQLQLFFENCLLQKNGEAGEEIYIPPDVVVEETG